MKSSFGTGSEQAVYQSPHGDFMISLSADGQTGWVQSSIVGKPSRDIFRVSLRDGQADVFLGTPFDEFQPVPSPDNRWLAYVSDETGRREVYVQSLGGDGGKWQISTDGGQAPLWTRGGREIIFQGRDGRLIAVEVVTSPAFSAGNLKPLFDPKMRSNAFGRMWDVTADGERFLVNRLVDAPEVEPLTLVQNWERSLKK